MDRYLEKENYVTRDSDPEAWRNHANGLLITLYKDLIKGDVIDFGCNHGACSFLLCENDNVKKVYGLDLNQEAINVANETKLKLPNHNIEFICDNVLNFNNDMKFDTVISFHTIEHIYPEDIDVILQKFHNMLPQGGYFITSIPYEKAYDNGVQHVAYYNESSLSELFEKNGFYTPTNTNKEQKKEEILAKYPNAKFSGLDLQTRKTHTLFYLPATKKGDEYKFFHETFGFASKAAFNSTVMKVDEIMELDIKILEEFPDEVKVTTTTNNVDWKTFNKNKSKITEYGNYEYVIKRIDNELKPGRIHAVCGSIGALVKDWKPEHINELWYMMVSKVGPIRETEQNYFRLHH
jgi:2-polyprenyl-3-methyl-5-hydroxy-6-metoxy-1,4-benzoquinol methylase